MPRTSPPTRMVRSYTIALVRTALGVLACWALCLVAAPAAADAPGIAVVLSDGAGALGEPLLLALRLEFPDRTVELVADGAPEEGRVAVVRVTRTAAGIRVRVEETATHVAVEREIPAGDSGDEPAAHAAALLARSLLGVALLYEADREPDGTEPAPDPSGAEPPPAPAPAAAAAPGLRAQAGVSPSSPNGTRTAPLEGIVVLSAGAILSSPFAAGDPTRSGGRLALSIRPLALPLEAGLEVAWLGAATFAVGDVTTARYEGTPFGAWVRVRVLRRPFELVPGLGLTLERSTVVAGPREYADWNTAAAAEVRARVRIFRALHLEGGLRAAVALGGGQEYHWAGDRVFGVAGPAWGADLGLSANVP